MFNSIDAFLTYVGAVNQRAARDVAAFPPEADARLPAAVREDCRGLDS